MKKIVILGAGESGSGAAVLAKVKGFEVFVSDMAEINPKYKKLLDEHQIEWEEKQHTEEKILRADEIIKSPGIPDTTPIVKKNNKTRHPNNQRNRIRRALHKLENDLHNRKQR